MVSHQLVFDICQDEGGSPVHTEVVRIPDLIDPLSELWWVAGPRRGNPELSLAELSYELAPVYRSTGAPYCEGFTLTANGGSGPPLELLFDRASLEHVPRRAARQLLATGELLKDRTFFYHLRGEASADSQVDGGKAPLTTPTVSYLEHPLPPLFERARQQGPEPDPRRHAVFFTEHALELCERLSRRGAAETPPVESGCVLVGSLVRCPETGDMFTVCLDALEATDAEQREFSLAFTAATWSRIQVIMRARRTQEATRTQRILGQAHSHPFLPGSQSCNGCPKIDSCQLTTAFLSADDLEWSRAIFAGEPWQLGLIFGLNPRGRNVSALYSQHRGVLAPRGFHVLSEFPVS